MKRLHRAAAEQHRRGAAARPLTEEQCRHWKAAMRDGLVAKVPSSQEEAVRAASDACNRACRKQQQADDAGWRQRFRSWAPSAIKAAAPTLRASCAAAAFTAADMRDAWVPWWSPGEEVRRQTATQAEAWAGLADEGRVPHQAARPWQPPTEEAFIQALRRAHGVAGLDGWCCDELAALLKHTPWLVTELHGLLVWTTVAAEAGLPQSLREMLYSWRVAGIPNRATDESRPIAIASCIMRAWHRALLGMLPPAPPGQWCGRPNSGTSMPPPIGWLPPVNAAPS